MYPQAWLIPAVVLATLATVIATQAVISGAYSMTKQAMQLGLLPRLQVLYTSAKEAGQTAGKQSLPRSVCVSRTRRRR